MASHFRLGTRSPGEQTRTTQVRHSEALGELIEQAADILAVDKSTFLRAAIESAAREIVEEHQRHVMTEADAVAFMAAMDRSVRPTEQFRAAVRDYRSRVVHGD